MSTKSPYSKEQIKSMVKIVRPELLYQIRTEYGDNLDFSSASGRELLNHLRHNVTNYDDVLEQIRIGIGENGVSNFPEGVTSTPRTHTHSRL
jgi:hypothetical protein